AAPEDAADDGRLLERALLARPQEVDSGREHALDRVRQLEPGELLARTPASVLAHDPPLVDQLAQDLLEEERVALGPGEYLRACVVAQAVDVEQVGDELGCRVLRQRSQEDGRDVAATAAPLGTGGGQLGPR